MRLEPSFASGPSFLDPPTCNDGTPYGPKHYKELVKQCWYISDCTHTSYADVLDLAYVDRMYLIGFIQEKQEATRKAIEESNAQLRAKR